MNTSISIIYLLITITMHLPAVEIVPRGNDNYSIILSSHEKFSDDNYKYLVSVYFNDENVCERIMVKNDDSIQYVRDAVNWAHQDSGTGNDKKFIKAIEAALRSPMKDDVAVFIPQTLITYKENGKWTTRWCSSGIILSWYFRFSVERDHEK